MRHSISVVAVPELGLPHGVPVSWGRRYVPRRFTVKVSEIVPRDVYVRDGTVVCFVEYAHQWFTPAETASFEIQHVSAGELRYELDIQMVDNQPRCQQIRPTDTAAGLTSTLLKRIPLERLVMQATARISRTSTGLEPWEPITGEQVDDAAASYKRPRRRKRAKRAKPAVAKRDPITPERLHDVAEAFRAGGIPEIERRLGVSRVYAHKLRTRALEAGEDITPPRRRV